MSSSPAPSGTLTPGLDALLHSAAFAPIDNTGWIRVTGSDRVRWLNGMVTNNIAALKPGEGNYNFFLNAQGRIQGDCTAWMQEDSILLETSPSQTNALMAMLDHFIIMDDVELIILEDRHGLQIAGPSAFSIVRTLGTGNGAAEPCSVVPTPSQPDATTPWLLLRQTLYADASVDLIRAHTPTVTRFELWSDHVTIAAIVDELNTTTAITAVPEDLENLRILSGTPLYGVDIRDKDLPQETNQTRALHFAKGCYLGQEIVERIRSRGAVHRTFTGFVLTGDLPTPGTPLAADGKPVGELTSVARIGDRTVALGYIRREILDRNASIQYSGGAATPSALPFPIASKS